MRYALAITALAFLAAAPLRAQEEGGQEKTATETQTEQAAPSPAGALASDWTKLESHWQMVQSMSGPEKAKHLEMHKAMTDELMGKLEAQGGAPPAEGVEGAAPGEGAEAGIGKAEEHWKAVENIEDPAQLETHLGMQMSLLEGIFGGGGGAAVAPGHEGMEHGDMQHEEQEEIEEGEPGYEQKPEKKKPAGY